MSVRGKLIRLERKLSLKNERRVKRVFFNSSFAYVSRWRIA